MQQTTLTIYAVPVPPTNQGCVTRYIEYDISRAPKATVMQNMRASAVIVHIRSASLCLFSLGRGGTRHVAKARLMAWASMAPLCSHHAFMHAFIHSFIHPSMHPSIHACIHSFTCLNKRPAQSLLVTWRMTPAQNTQSASRCCAREVDAYWTQTSWIGAKSPIQSSFGLTSDSAVLDRCVQAYVL